MPAGQDICDVPEAFLGDFSEQVEARRLLWRAYISGRLASAYLFAGPSGVGKFPAALEFARFVKCTRKAGGAPCGECKSCRTAKNWDNPDIMIIFPMPASVWESDDASDAYASLRSMPYLRPQFPKPAFVLLSMVHQIRRFLSTPASLPGGKFVIIADAHKMNTEAANAFLKTLEEPPPGSHIILTTDSAEALLPTIRSRAQLIRFKRLSTDEVSRLLVERFGFSAQEASAVAPLAEGSIAAAIKLASDDFAEARRQALHLISEAAAGKLASLVEWASQAPKQLDYAQMLLWALLSLARDIAVAAAGGKNILNADAANITASAAAKIKSPYAALKLVRRLATLRDNLARNPQYALLYGALVDALWAPFARKAQ